MSFSESDLRDIQRKIGDLGSNEHSEILKLPTMLTNNKNGAFCDLTKLDDDVLLSIQNFVNFSTDNNIRLAQYDRQLHYTSVMMQASVQ
jgi:hypothetical protein